MRAAQSGPSAPSPAQQAGALITPATDRAIQRGIAWLVRRQQDDGSWGSGVFRGNTAVTALAGTALLASGSTPGRGEYARPLDKAVEYLLTNTQPSGFINASRGVGPGPMYNHGFSALFLAECYGMSSRKELRDVLARAVRLIVNTQNREGGWRYLPQRGEADISVTICQVMALRAARNAGLHVPKETIDRSLDYIKRCQNPDGGFSYRLEGQADRDSGYPRSAAAVAAFYGAGIYDSPELRNGLKYLHQVAPRGVPGGRETYLEYGQYYAAQAMWQAGGERWAAWYPGARDDALSRQSPDGSWASVTCPEYATSMYLTVLQIPNNCLPIFQR